METLIPITEEEFYKLPRTKRTPYYFTPNQLREYLHYYQFQDFLEVQKWINFFRKPENENKKHRNKNGVYVPKPSFRIHTSLLYYYKRQGLYHEVMDIFDTNKMKTKQYDAKQRKRYWTYETAKEFIQKLEFKSKVEFDLWVDAKPPVGVKSYVFILNYYKKYPIKPKKFPRKPHLEYTKQKLWTGWEDFLGCTVTTTSWSVRYEYSRQKAIDKKLYEVSDYLAVAQTDPKMLQAPLRYARKHGLLYTWAEFVDLPVTAEYIKTVTYECAQKILSLIDVRSLNEYAEFRKKYKLQAFLPSNLTKFYSVHYEKFNIRDFIKQPLLLRFKLQEQFTKCFCVYRNLTNGMRMVIPGKSAYHLLLELDITQSTKSEFYFFELNDTHQYDIIKDRFCIHHGNKHRYYIAQFEQFITACRNTFPEITIFQFPIQNKIAKRPRQWHEYEGRTRTLAEYLTNREIRELRKQIDEELYEQQNIEATKEASKPSQ